MSCMLKIRYTYYIAQAGFRLAAIVLPQPCDFWITDMKCHAQ